MGLYGRNSWYHSYDFWRSCRDEELEESLEQYFCDCKGLISVGHKFLEKHLVDYLAELVWTKIRFLVERNGLHIRKGKDRSLTTVFSTRLLFYVRWSLTDSRIN